jgi:hypothetical protein
MGGFARASREQVVTVARLNGRKSHPGPRQGPPARALRQPAEPSAGLNPCDPISLARVAVDLLSPVDTRHFNLPASSIRLEPLARLPPAPISSPLLDLAPILSCVSTSTAFLLER